MKALTSPAGMINPMSVSASTMIAAFLLACVACPPAVRADPVVPGATVEIYASANAPAWLSFDRQSGTLFTGVEAGMAVKIWRIAVGGHPVEGYGAVPIQDPDAVLHDPTGLMTGVPGSVLVGGRGGGTPQIWAILPDSAQSVVSVFGPSSQWVNISDMEFDQDGRLLFGEEDGQDGRVFASSAPGEFPAQLFAAGGRLAALEVDDANRIFTSTFDGTIRLHSPDGTVISDPFLSGLGDRLLPMALGPGGAWGADLYTVNQFTGELIRADMTADTTVVGTGFDGFLIDFEFGPDGALYMSDLGLARIWRIAMTPTTGMQAGAVADAAPALRATCVNPSRPPTTIRYELAESGRATLRIYDVRGRLVRALVDRTVRPGPQTVTWDGLDSSGRAVSSATYFFRIESQGRSLSEKLTVLE